MNFYVETVVILTPTRRLKLTTDRTLIYLVVKYYLSCIYGVFRMFKQFPVFNLTVVKI